MCSNEFLVGGVTSIAVLAASIDGLAATDVSASPVSGVADELVVLHKQLARLQGQIARRVAVVDSASGGQIDGHVSTASWLRSACSLSASQASGLLKVARGLRDRPATAAALNSGRVSCAHAQVITTTLSDLPSDAHAAAESILLEAAETTMLNKPRCGIMPGVGCIFRPRWMAWW